ncbi:MAG: hypothetical protein K5770_13680 [Lachnospiraceae bacterium]|nr:hypothetical protein [Lachnospiraceae bacterium]
MKKMKKNSIITGLLTLAFCLCQCLPVFAQDGGEGPEVKETNEIDSAGNLFSSGDDFSLSLDSVYCAFALGRNIDVSGAESEGSLFALARDITIRDTKVGESIFLGAETVSVTGTSADGNIFSMGRKVDISGTGRGVYAMGETVNFDGEARGVCIAANSVFIGGTINGDVKIDAGQNITIDPDTVITGSLYISGQQEPEVPDSAEIGEYTFEQKTGEADGDASEASEATGSKIGGIIGKTIYWIAAMSLLGIILCWLFGSHLKNAGEVFLNSPGSAAGRGVLAWLLTPVLAVLMCCTVILAPAGGILLAVYVILLCIGLCFTGASLGRLVFRDMHPFLSAVICIAVLEVVRQIPFLGTVIGALADIYLLSYVVYCLSETLNKKKKRPEAVPVPAETGAETGEQDLLPENVD